MTKTTKSIILAIASQLFVNSPLYCGDSVLELYREFISQCIDSDYESFIRALAPYIDISHEKLVFPNKSITLDGYIMDRVIEILT